MANKFQNILDFGGVDISRLPDKIGDTSSSDCNGIDFSLNNTIKTTGCGPSIGGVGSGAGYINGDMYVFKKAFGTEKEIIIRTNKDTSDNTLRLQWLNQDLSLGNYGRWENMYDDTFGTTYRFTFAPVNGDNNQKINRLIISGGDADQGRTGALVWNGATASVTGWAENQITTNRTSLAKEGFEVYAHKSSEIMVNGKLYTYTGLSGGTFTGVLPNPVNTPPSLKDGVTQNVNNELTFENIITKSDITFAAATNGTLTSAAYNFEEDFFIGQKVYIQGATNDSNTGIFTIHNISGSVITLEESTIVDEAAGATIIISSGVPRGKLVMSAQGKLWLSGVFGNDAKVYYSVTGVATCFAITSGLGSGGSFDLIEDGGYITAMNQIGQNKIVIHKKDLLTIYTRSATSDGVVVEDFDVAVRGVGVGAAGQHAITQYGKIIYYFSAGGEIRTISQSLYSSDIFDFSSISEKIENLLDISSSGNPYLIYNSERNCLILSVNSARRDALTNLLVYIYINRTNNGYEYKASFDEINYDDAIIDMPIIVSPTVSPVGVWAHFPYLRSTYLWNNDVISYDIQKNNYYISKEFTFGEPAQDKDFNILNIDGYLYGNTIIKFTVIYGAGGKDGSKSYYIDKNSPVVDDVVLVNPSTGEINNNLIGRNSIVNNYNQYGISSSYYFKMPIHIDSHRSDRYMIRIETWNSSLANTFWAINNISTNVVLKDVSYNDLINQNEESLDGVGTMIVGTTNIVGKQ